ncbi:hypothetical protein C7E15_09600 [Stenotrophomonas maltophilia]|nr:hypothetical protein C7E15_09600 [Stenotrophomonas maltophilia]
MGLSAGLRPAPAEASSQAKPRQRQRQRQKLAFRGLAGWVRLRGTLQVPLRGPAQPLAAVRSGACEAVLRKQSALTHVSSVAACSCAQESAHEQAAAKPTRTYLRRPRTPTPPRQTTDSPLLLLLRPLPLLESLCGCRAQPCRLPPLAVAATAH